MKGTGHAAGKGRAARSGHSGFTLLEMLMVLAIVALAIGVLLPRLTVQPRATAPAPVAYLEKERGLAIQNGKPVSVYYGDNELVAEPTGDRLKLDQHQTPDILRPAVSPYFRRRLVTVFYPDGTLLLAEFRLMQETGFGSTREIDRVALNPLHGEIIYVPH
jgi:prepilin-type N-terminal cleavage/methylation domain-containing protein